MPKLSLRSLATVAFAGLLALAAPVDAKDCGGAVPCDCGDRVISSVELTADLNNCPGHGLVVAAGVVDCAGLQIAGPGDRSAAVGVLLRGFSSAGAMAAEVRNCRIRNFGRGIEIDGGSGNAVRDSAIFNNEVGIWLGDGATGSVLERNHVRDNRDEGIHLGGSVSDTTVSGNTLANNRRENLYLIQTSGNVVLGNTFDDSDAAAILLKHADDNYFADNVIQQRIVLVRGDSNGNHFENNDLMSGYFHFEAIEETGGWSYPHDNHVVGGFLRKASTCFEFSGAYANSVSGTTVDTCQAKEEKERGGLQPHDNAVQVVRIDPGEHSTPGRRRNGSIRMAHANGELDRFTLDLRSFSPQSSLAPLQETIRCTLSDWEGVIVDVEVPPGVLRPRGKTGGGRLVDRNGTYGGLRRLDIRPLDDGSWRLKLVGRANASEADFPVMTLRCEIGDDVVSYSDFWTQNVRGWNLRHR